MKKLVLIPLVLFILFASIIFSTHTIFAASTGEWIDAANIKFNGKTYSDNKLFDSMDYKATGACSDENKDDEIKGFNKDFGESGTDYSKAKVKTYIKDPRTGDCSVSLDDNITLTNTSNSQIFFNWVDSSTVESVFTGFGGGVYKLIDGSNNEFLHDTSNDCKSGLIVSSPGTDTTLGSGSFEFRINFDGCRTNPYPVKIGSAENATKAAGTGTLTGASATGSGPEPSCENQGDDFSWLLCPALRLMDNIVTTLDNAIITLLKVPDPYLNDNGIKETWKRIRSLAYIILIPIMMVMIISTALGFEFVSAYTVKKSMPRLLAAVIFITLSYEICAFLIRLTNSVGGGVFGLITSSISGAGQITISGIFNPSLGNATTGALVGTVAVATIAAVGSIGILFSYMLVALLGIAIGFILLSFRQFLVVALILFSPIAILAWIYPGNDKLWKLWWGTFSKLLLLFPLIMVIIASGRAFAVIVQNLADNGGDGVFTGHIATLIKIIAYVGPYFFIPAAFKFAGGMFATISGMANDRGRGLFDRQKKFRGQQMAKTWQKTQSGTRFKAGKEGSVRSKLNTGFQGASMIGRAGLRPSRWKENMGNAIRDNRWESGLEAAEKIPGAKSFFANDDGMLAALEGDGDFDKAANYLVNEKGYAYDQARLVAAQGLRLRNDMGSQAFALTALAKLPGTGTAYKGEKGIEAWLRSINKYTGGNKGLAASVVSAGKGGFRNGQQYEFSEAGFGDVMQALDMVSGRQLKTLDDGTQVPYGDGEVGEFIVDKAYKALGASGFVNVRNDDSAKTLTRAAIRDLRGAVASGDKAVIGRSIAQLENIRDSSAQGKRTITDAYIKTLDENPITVAGKKINAVDYALLAKEAADPAVMAAYRQVKHDYGAESAEAARQQQNNPPNTQGPSPGPGQGTLPGMHL